MTVIAWDGVTLAVDRMGTTGDLQFEVQKLQKVADRKMAAVTGEFSAGLRLIRWYTDGADPSKWPECQRGEYGAILVVASPLGCACYEREPIQIPVIGKRAWGSGREVAAGAMAAGANAVRAVEIASQLCAGCGFGVDEFTPSRMGRCGSD